MNMFMEKILNSIIEIIVFSIIPLLWWFCTARKKCGFFQWIGLKPIGGNEKKKTLLWTVGIMIIFLWVPVLILFLMRDVETAVSEFTGMGSSAVAAVLVYAVFNTSLPEEIVFRGFLLKRISAKKGFAVANMVQAAIFGLMHGILFFPVAGAIKAAVIIFFTGVIAWLMGYMNEKKADGSIIPGWMIHAVSNIFSGLCAAFSVF